MRYILTDLHSIAYYSDNISEEILAKFSAGRLNIIDLQEKKYAAEMDASRGEIIWKQIQPDPFLLINPIP